MIAGRPEHREYTIDDTIYYAVGARLFYETDDRHDVEEIDDHPYHLYRGRPCRLRWGGSVYSQVVANPVGTDTSRDPPTWDHIPVDDFEPVPVLDTVTPDGIQECPGCGSWAGAVDDDNPVCLDCGWGLEPDGDTA